MHLYYPEGSTKWEWRIGEEGEVRDGSNNTGWKEYTGPITIRLSEVNDVYIRYMMNGKKVIVPPDGKIVVDIEPASYSIREGEVTSVEIVYDEGASIKEYQIDGQEWQEYNGSFEVGPDTLIAARAKKVVNGEVKTQYDYAYVSLYEDTIDTPDGPGSPHGGGDPYGGGGPYGPDNPYEPGGPWLREKREIPERLEGPVISEEPTEITREATITIDTYEEARSIYYSINNGKYKKYEGSFKVDKNCEIKAYYIREEDGRTSSKSYYTVSNIKVDNKPYVKISTDPGLRTWTNSMTVTITGSDYDSLEYSYDGNIYYEYTEALTVTKNCRIYAKGRNNIGETIEYIDITHIGEAPAKKITEELLVSIETNPEKSNKLLNKVEVTINYDNKAEEKYYTINGGKLKKYTGSFTLEENATIVAYAKSEDGYGEAVKEVDYLTTGIISPVIKPETKELVSELKVNITYDSNASVKKYKIDDGEWYDYTGTITITENNVLITAYNENSLGYQAQAHI